MFTNLGIIKHLIILKIFIVYLTRNIKILIRVKYTKNREIEIVLIIPIW